MSAVSVRVKLEEAHHPARVSENSTGLLMTSDYMSESSSDHSMASISLASSVSSASSALCVQQLSQFKFILDNCSFGKFS